MASESVSYDIFLCYAWEDKWRADPLRAALEQEGMHVFQDVGAMVDFDHIGDRVDAGLRGSRTLLVLYSQAMLESTYCRQELHVSLLRAERLGSERARVLAVVPEGRFDEVQPRRLKEWRLPDPDQPLGQTAAAIAVHVRALAATDDRRFGQAAEPAPPAEFPEGWRIRPDLHGRELDLWAIHDGLFLSADDSDPGRSVVAVVGMSGIGKTMLARSYAWEFADHVPGGVYHVDAGGSELAGNTRAQLADRHHRQQLLARASSAAGEEPYLWIVDDVPPDLDDPAVGALLAPTDAGVTLITARQPLEWLRADQHLHLGPLPRTASLSVLVDRLPIAGGRERRLDALRENPGELIGARSVAERLGHHPLALALAAALVGRGEVSTFHLLDERLSRHDSEILALASELRVILPTDRVPSVASALWAGIRSLPNSDRTIGVASLLAAQPVPRELIEGVVAEADGLSAAEARRVVGDDVGEAAERSLAEPVTVDGVDCLLVHPLVGLAVRSMVLRPSRRRELPRQAASWLADRLDVGWSADPPATVATYLPHIRAVATALVDADEWYLLNEAGRIHGELGDGAEALALYEHLHDRCRQALGPSDPTTLAMLVGLGVAAGLVGDHAAAAEHKRTAVDLLVETAGADHPDTLVAVNNLAVTYGDMGDDDRSEALFDHVYRRRLAALGPVHPDVIEARMNHSIALGRRGESRRAAQIKQEVYDLAHATMQPADPRILDALNNLAASLVERDPPAARARFRELLERRRRLSGPSAAVADTLENLALVTDERAERIGLFEESYRIRLSIQGPAHPRTRLTLRCLLGTLQSENGAVNGRASGHEPVEVLPAELHLGSIRLDADDMDERIETHDLAMAWQEHCVDRKGADAVITMTAVCYLAHAHALLGQFDDQLQTAWVCAKDAAQGLTLELGPEHEAAVAADRLVVWLADILA
ncbi:MAG: toll/interleukin-1 receptor domain-containing protein [Actinomycetota bacterium]